ncbi:MAG: hypothetical protein WAQ24_04580 [Candidatus Saccharimonadales bacterium]
MKQKDIVVIIVVAFFSSVMSFLLSNRIFVTPENRQQTIEKVDPISIDFTLPDKRFFNEKSINPTLTSQLSTNANQNPFNGTGQ